MIMVTQEGISHDADFVAAAGARQGADDDAVELRRGGEQEAALDGASGDLHQGAAVGDEEEESCHGVSREGKGRANPAANSGLAGKLLKRNRLASERRLRRAAAASKRFGELGGETPRNSHTIGVPWQRRGTGQARDLLPSTSTEG